MNYFNAFPPCNVITPTLHKDDRGYLFEAFKQSKETETFVQDNISISKKNVVRGMHYQKGMGKLIIPIEGKILDVILDIRSNSPTVGCLCSMMLSSEEHTSIYIPPGFAHGFRALSDRTIVLYKCTAEYDKHSEGAINPLDENIKHIWNTAGDRNDIIISERDKEAQQLSDYLKAPMF